MYRTSSLFVLFVLCGVCGRKSYVSLQQPKEPTLYSSLVKYIQMVRDFPVLEHFVRDLRSPSPTPFIAHESSLLNEESVQNSYDFVVFDSEEENDVEYEPVREPRVWPVSALGAVRQQRKMFFDCVDKLNKRFPLQNLLQKSPFELLNFAGNNQRSLNQSGIQCSSPFNILLGVELLPEDVNKSEKPIFTKFLISAIEMLLIRKYVPTLSLLVSQDTHSSPKMPTNRVLIVGGGPSGLISAITLRKTGNSVTIVEKRTGEYNRLISLVNRQYVCDWFNTNLQLNMQVTELISVFEMEYLLVEFAVLLNVQIHFNSELTSLGRNSSGHFAVVQSGQRKRSIPYDILIGADGVNSVTREKAKFRMRAHSVETPVVHVHILMISRSSSLDEFRGQLEHFRSVFTWKSAVFRQLHYGSSFYGFIVAVPLSHKDLGSVSIAGFDNESFRFTEKYSHSDSMQNTALWSLLSQRIFGRNFEVSFFEQFQVSSSVFVERTRQAAYSFQDSRRFGLVLLVGDALQESHYLNANGLEKTFLIAKHLKFGFGKRFFRFLQRTFREYINRKARAYDIQNAVIALCGYNQSGPKSHMKFLRQCIAECRKTKRRSHIFETRAARVQMCIDMQEEEIC